MEATLTPPTSTPPWPFLTPTSALPPASSSGHAWTSSCSKSLPSLVPFKGWSPASSASLLEPVRLFCYYFFYFLFLLVFHVYGKELIVEKSSNRVVNILSEKLFDTSAQAYTCPKYFVNDFIKEWVVELSVTRHVSLKKIKLFRL